MFRKILLVAALLVAPVAAEAAVTINMSGGLLTENDAVTPLAGGNTIILIADADQDGFGDFTQPDSWSDDPGDVVIDHRAIVELCCAGSFTSDVTGVPLTDGVSPGDPVMLLWYVKSYDAGDVGAGEGVYFGTYRGTYYDEPWAIPSDGWTVDWFDFVTEHFGGSLPDSLGVANQVTIPEPATMVLLSVGAGAALLRRRRA